MGSFTTSCWPQVLLHMLLLQLQSAKVQAADPMSLKLRRLNEQFHQFKASAQARLDTLALNQDRTSSQGQKSRVQPLNNHSHHMSRDLVQLKRSTALDIDAIREWSRKLEKRNKRMDARLALMERKLREKCQHTRKPIPNPGVDFSNFTLELQSQEERLVALQTHHDELLLGLKGFQESMNEQALRVSQLEGQLSKVFQGTAKVEVGGPTSSHITAEKPYDSQRRTMNRGGMSGRIPERHMQPRSESVGQSDTYLQAKSHQLHETNQPDSHLKPHVQHPEPESDLDFSVLTRTSPNKQEHIQVQSPSYLQRRTRLPDQEHTSLMQPLSHRSSRPDHKNPLQDRMRLGGTHSPNIHPRGRDEGQERESDTNLESSVIRDFLQIPVRHKIPDQPLPRKDAVICNVDSMLLFPSASAENYVTFSVGLPNLPELSLCLWLRVEAAHVGTLLSYATDDNDNQLVLYGRRSSTLSTPFPLSSHPSYSFPPPSAFSSPSLDFVIGDPVYRRLPVASLLDTRWHHLCVVWSSIQGRFWHYSDRYLTSSGSKFRKGWEIPGGGSVVLGQEQDTVGGGFDPAEGFAGQIAGFRVWNRVLSSSEVEGVANGRGVPRGVVLGMEDIKEVHGAVEQVACECLEHCV